jgi:hypothetical protein
LFLRCLDELLANKSGLVFKISEFSFKELELEVDVTFSANDFGSDSEIIVESEGIRTIFVSEIMLVSSLVLEIFEFEDSVLDTIRIGERLTFMFLLRVQYAS